MTNRFPRPCFTVLRTALCVAALLAAPCAQAAPLAQWTPEQYRANLAQSRQLAEACKANAAACDDSKVADDAEVGEHGKPGHYLIQWSWLRVAVRTAQKANPEERAKQMDAVEVRLGGDEQELGAPVAPSAFLAARANATRILATPEFQQVKNVSWWDRMLARILSWIRRLLQGIFRAGAQVPWLWTALEYGLFVAALGALGFFLLRSLQRQHARVSLSDGARLASAWETESDDWARMAETFAAQQEWREAVHALYWASIVLLESRRAWKHNPSRTPREYVRLLKPNTPQRNGLRGLTQIFERLWYGFDDGSAEEFAAARGYFDSLQGGADAAVPKTEVA